MTFLDIFQDVARRCDKNPTSPDPETNARLRTFINDRYREVMRIPGVMDLRDEVFDAPDYTFQSEANENRVVLPASIRAITNIIDSTHRIKLKRVTMPWIREHDPSQPGTAKGTPTHYAVVNQGGVLDQPTSILASSLTLVSTSAADIGPQVSVAYQDQYGAFRVIQVALSGTTPVVVPVTAALLFRLSIDGPQTGEIRLLETATSNVLMTLPPNSLMAQTNNPHSTRGWTLWLWPTPSGVNSYTVDGTRPRAALVEWMDEPVLPEDFHTLLVWGACEDELLHMDDNRSQQFAERWRNDVKALRGFLHQVRGERLIPTGGRQRPGWSPLGGNYPPWQ